MDALKHLVLQNMAGFQRQTVEGAHLRRAAVAILLSPVDGQPAFALTRRALTLRRGAGNFALPGGHTDPGETPLETALRETHEELGVALRYPTYREGVSALAVASKLPSP